MTRIVYLVLYFKLLSKVKFVFPVVSDSISKIEREKNGLQISNAGSISVNGLFSCIKSAKSKVHKCNQVENGNIYLERMHIMGKQGKQAVWGLRDGSTVLYICRSLDSGEKCLVRKGVEPPPIIARTMNEQSCREFDADPETDASEDIRFLVSNGDLLLMHGDSEGSIYCYTKALALMEEVHGKWMRMEIQLKTCRAELRQRCLGEDASDFDVWKCIQREDLHDLLKGKNGKEGLSSKAQGSLKYALVELGLDFVRDRQALLNFDLGVWNLGNAAELLQLASTVSIDPLQSVEYAASALLTFMGGNVDRGLELVRKCCNTFSESVTSNENFGRDESIHPDQACKQFDSEGAVALLSKSVPEGAAYLFTSSWNYLQAILGMSMTAKDVHWALSSELYTIGALEDAVRHLHAINSINEPPCPKARLHAILMAASPLILSNPDFNNNDLSSLKEIRIRLKRGLEEVLNDHTMFNSISRPEQDIPISFQFYQIYQGGNDYLELIKLWKDVLLYVSPVLNYSAPHLQTAKSTLVDRDNVLEKPFEERSDSRAKKLKIGFLSAHFYFHSVGRLMVGLISKLSKTKYEIYLLETKVPGTVNEDDAVRKAFMNTNLPMIRLSSNLVDAQRQIAELKLDVLVYTEVGMSSLVSYLAYARLASVQIAFWGHPATTGLPTMDYFVTSELFEWDDGHLRHSEQLIQLEGLNTFFYPPDVQMEDLISMEELGIQIPQDSNTYSVLQTTMKFHPGMDKALLSILSRDPQGHLIILQSPARPLWNAQLRRRLFNAAIARFSNGNETDYSFSMTETEEEWSNEGFIGTTKTASSKASTLFQRVHWVDQMEYSKYLGLLCASDVSLDPFPFGGGVTAFEAFWCGTYFITLPPYQIVHRLAQGLASKSSPEKPFNQTELMLVANTLEEYVAKAVSLNFSYPPTRGRESQKCAHSKDSGSSDYGCKNELLSYVQSIFKDEASIDDWDVFLSTLKQTTL